MAKGQRVMIVFEQTGDVPLGDTPGTGTGFRVYLEGAERTLGKQDCELTTAEFYALKCFRIVGDVLSRSGAIQSVANKPDA